MTTAALTPSQYCLLRLIAQDGGAYDPQDAALAIAFLNSPNASPMNPNVPNPFCPNNDPNLKTFVNNHNGTFDNPTRNHNFTTRLDYQTRGNHNLKAGISYRPAVYSINNPNWSRGEFDFYDGFSVTSPGGQGFAGFNGQAYGVPSYPALSYLLGSIGYCPPPPPNRKRELFGGAGGN